MKAAERNLDLHHRIVFRQLMLRAEADRLRNNFAAYKKSREEVNLIKLRVNWSIGLNSNKVIPVYAAPGSRDLRIV